MSATELSEAQRLQRAEAERRESRDVGPVVDEAVIETAGPVKLLLLYFTLALGVVLGVVNQFTFEAENGVRLPAFIAAMLLVGLSLRALMEDANARKAAEGPTSERRLLAGAAWAHNQVAAMPKPGGIEGAMPMIMIVVAIWLGWANLTSVVHTAWLMGLSLVASFWLFALAVRPDEEK